MEDQIVISRLKQGDLSAVELLVKRYQVQAVHAAYAIVQDKALADDVVQAAFVKVLEKIHQYDETRPFEPWFFRIVVNDAIKAAKKQQRTISLEEQQDQSATRIAKWLISPESRPEDLLEKNEMRENILNALQLLKPEQRAVIVMRYFLEMSEMEMSKKMERPLSTIKWWLRDARKRLKKLISPYLVDDGK